MAFKFPEIDICVHVPDDKEKKIYELDEPNTLVKKSFTVDILSQGAKLDIFFEINDYSCNIIQIIANMTLLLNIINNDIEIKWKVDTFIANIDQITEFLNHINLRLKTPKDLKCNYDTILHYDGSNVFILTDNQKNDFSVKIDNKIIVQSLDMIINQLKLELLAYDI